MSEHYILDGKIAVPVDDVLEWARRFDQKTKRVAKDEVAPGVVVSTVFLGLNHQYGDGPPLIFETRIFGGDHDQDMDRCSTWEEAEEMHHRMVALAATPAPPETTP